MMKKILIVFGTRPEAIKMVPVIKELKKHPNKFDVRVCITAQHREMLDQVINIFNIKPDYDLNIMQPNQDLFDITSRTLLKMKDVLTSSKPDLVMVHGDTTTSTTAALSAYYFQIPVAHVEAGLRTGNIYSPWPEEMNRRMTGVLTTIHLSPTKQAKQNLITENVNQDSIFVTGNTVIDTLQMASAKMEEDKQLKTKIEGELSGYFNSEFKQIVNTKFILVTGHRRENFGDGFIQICESIKEIALRYPKINIIYPVHLNPNVQKPVYELLGKINNVHLIPPISYLPFIYLLKNCYFVLTDSGGIQEEAPSFGKPVLVMRDTTERPEAVDAGTVKLVGANKAKIVDESCKLIDDKNYYTLMATAHNPYGDGKAAKRIVEVLLNDFNN